MLRHKRNVHPCKDQDESEPEQMELTDDSDTEDVVDEYDPWNSLIDKTFENCQEEFEEKVEKLMNRRGMDKTDAMHRAYEELKSSYRKSLIALLTKRVRWFNAMQADSVYKAIRRTAKELIDVDNYEREEGWKYAISKRKYLLDRILEDYEPPKLKLEDDEGSEDDETPHKRAKTEETFTA